MRHRTIHGDPRPALARRARTSQSALLALALLTVAAAACAPAPSEQGIAGPTRIRSDWVEIEPPVPLRSVESMQEVFATRDGIADWDAASSSIVLADGTRARIEAWLVDSRGEEYELTLSGIGGRGGFYLARKSAVFPAQGLTAPTPHFPADRTYVRLRIRSSQDIAVRQLVWVCRSNT